MVLHNSRRSDQAACTMDRHMHLQQVKVTGACDGLHDRGGHVHVQPMITKVTDCLSDLEGHDHNMNAGGQAQGAPMLMWGGSNI
jgi:hypothetical protein